MQRYFQRFLSVALFSFYFFPSVSNAQLGLDTTSIINALSNQINTPSSQAAIKSLITLTALSTDLRNYESATPLGTTFGIDMGVDLTLVRLAPDLLAQISNATGSSPTTLPAAPVPMLHFDKGFGMVDIGIGYLGFLPEPYTAYRIYAASAKLSLYAPPEGISWALRTNYTVTSFGIVSTYTWTPQLLISVPMDFFDPYLGVGYEIANGSISTTLSQTVAGLTVSAPINASAAVTAFQTFGGLALKFGPSGLKLALEMAYNSTGMGHMGARFGLCF